nr:putative reverse transcriptase domain-containing protein [Tanacetum cinerariifolium]
SLLPQGFLSPYIRPLSPRALGAEMNVIASSLYHSLHQSGAPPLLPIPLSTPSTSRRTGILEADTPPRNRPLLATPRPGCEVGEKNPRNMHTARPCYYANFMKCHPLNFKGTEGAVGLTCWIEKMESVFNISGCAVENHVKFATCTLLDATLTWWNSQIRTLGPDAYTMT